MRKWLGIREIENIRGIFFVLILILSFNSVLNFDLSPQHNNNSSSSNRSVFMADYTQDEISNIWNSQTIEKSVNSGGKEEPGLFSPQILFYSVDGSGQYMKSAYDTEFKQLIENLGFNITIGDRNTIAAPLNSTSFENLSQFWLMNGGNSGNPITDEEETLILNEWRNGTNLVLAGGEGLDYQSVNEISKHFGVRHDGSIAFEVNKTPIFADHPIWANVTALYADNSGGHPSIIIDQDSDAINLSFIPAQWYVHALFENSTGKIFWESSCRHFMDDYIGYSDNVQYISNLARYLQEPEISLHGVENNSLLSYSSQIALRIIDDNLGEVQYNWNDNLNQSITNPFLIPLPIKDGWNLLNIYAEDDWNHTCCKVYRFYQSNEIKPPAIFIYSTSLNDYNRTSFNNETKSILEEIGFYVLVEDRYTIPVLNASHLTNISQLWIINGADGYPFTTEEIELIIGAWRNGMSLVLMGAQSGFHQSVNQIGERFGVEYEGDYSVMTWSRSLNFTTHPIWQEVSTLYAWPWMPQLLISNPSAQILSTDTDNNAKEIIQHVLIENSTSTVFWGNKFTHLEGYYTSYDNNSQYITNIARYLQKPKIKLIGELNNSIIRPQTNLSFHITDENLVNISYNWNNNPNQSIYSFNIFVGSGEGWNQLNIYVKDQWNQPIHIVYRFNVVSSSSLISIQSDEEFNNQGWPGDGTNENPFVISNFYINGFGGSCIEIKDTTSVFIITDCILYGATGVRKAGIFLSNVSNGWIKNNNCSGSDSIDINYAGIWLESTSNITITNNSCEYNGYGVILWDLFGSVTNTNVSMVNNTCSNNHHGIALYSSSSNTISNNTCTNNTGNGGIYLTNSSENLIVNNTCNDNSGIGGIWLEFSESNDIINNNCSVIRYGIFLSSSNNNNLTSNTCNNNSIDGIRVSDSDFNTFYNNTIALNDGNGIYFRGNGYSSDYNTVSWNIFEKNSGSDAYDNGTGNSFSFNYWLDYAMIDNDGDSIGDIPFSIPGSAENSDPYPISNFFPSISLINPSNYTVQDVGVVINLEIRDSNLETVFYNWDGNPNQPFTHPWTLSLPQTDGWHWLHIYANDSLGLQNYQKFLFYVDVIAPIITLVGISNETVVIAEESLYLNISDMSLNSVWFNWDGNDNKTLYYPFIIQVLSNEGWHKLTIYANDSTSNLSRLEYMLRVNHNPKISLIAIDNSSIINPHSAIDFNITDTSLDLIWFSWDSNPSIILDFPYTVSIPNSTQWHYLTIFANDSWGGITEKYYAFYILSAPNVDIIQPANQFYVNEPFTFSFTLTNNEIISIDYFLLILSESDEILKGNGSSIILSPGESQLIELIIKPNHASIHYLLINIYIGGNFYHQDTIEFKVNPQWMSPRFYIPFILSPLIFLFLLILIGSVSFYFYRSSKRFHRILTEKLTPERKDISLSEVKESSKIPEFILRMGIKSDRNLLLTPDGRIIDEIHQVQYIKKQIMMKTTPINLISMAQEIKCTLTLIKSIVNTAIRENKLHGFLIRDIFYPSAFISSITTALKKQQTRKISEFLDEHKLSKSILEIIVKEIVKTDKTVFTIYKNSDEDKIVILSREVWKKIIKNQSTSNGFVIGQILPDLTASNWQSIFKQQKIVIFQYNDRFFNTSGLQEYTVAHMDEISRIIHYIRHQLPYLPLSISQRREILQTFEHLLPVEPVHLPYFCQMDSAMIVKEQFAYVCMECKRMICSSCFKEMKQTGMENCIHCGGNLNQHPAIQLEMEIARVDQMKGHEFENFLEGLFRTQGYQVVNIQSSGDHGVDLVVVKSEVRTGVQAKRFKPSTKIGNNVLIKLKGGGYFHDCQKLLVITTSYYTSKAKEYAEGVGIELWDRNTLKNYLSQYNKHLGEK